VVIAIIAILAALLFPVFSQAKESAKKSACLSNLRSIGMSLLLYQNDHDDRMPDMRYIKAVDYRPWTSWPPSDPRAGWYFTVFGQYSPEESMSCPSVRGSRMGTLPQVLQGPANYWMWRFDRTDDPVPLDNFWGKTSDQAVTDLNASNNPTVGAVNSDADAELAVDPYFPSTIPSVATELRGLSVHIGGRNRVFLDAHVKWLRDRRLRP